MTATNQQPIQQKILNEILRDAHEAGRKGERCLAIFDLDSTLFDLTARVQSIVDAYAQLPDVRARYPQACLALNQVRIGPKDWGIREALERAGLFENEHPDFYRDLHEHWAFCFFSSSYLHIDQPLPGAVEIVQALETENAHILYLTGRDVGRMLEGTIQSLRTWGFPLDKAHTQLILKPEAGMDDAEFKLDIVREAVSKYQRVWLFENEPVNLNLIAKHCPSVHLVFIDSTHSGREQLETALARIPHFETDLEEFKAFKASRGQRDGS